MKLWAGRLQGQVDEKLNQLNASIGFDSRMYRQDITGSMAHAKMLGKQGIIPAEDSEKIVSGLQDILSEIWVIIFQIVTNADNRIFTCLQHSLSPFVFFSP